MRCLCFEDEGHGRFSARQHLSRWVWRNFPQSLSWVAHGIAFCIGVIWLRSGPQRKLRRWLEACGLALSGQWMDRAHTQTRINSEAPGIRNGGRKQSESETERAKSRKLKKTKGRILDAQGLHQSKNAIEKVLLPPRPGPTSLRLTKVLVKISLGERQSLPVVPVNFFFVGPTQSDRAASRRFNTLLEGQRSEQKHHHHNAGVRSCQERTHGQMRWDKIFHNDLPRRGPWRHWDIMSEQVSKNKTRGECVVMSTRFLEN